MHALIIEDQFMVAAIIEDELRELGFETFDHASNEEEAVRLAEERFPDLITADGGLSQGGGVAAVRRICTDQTLPVVFISADPETIARNVPGAVILEKPFTYGDLKRAVERAALIPYIVAA